MPESTPDVPYKISGTENDGEVMGTVMMDGVPVFIEEKEGQPRTAEQPDLTDVKGKKIKLGADIRLSDKGKKKLILSIPVISKYPNLRSKVVYISAKGSVFVKPEDIELVTPIKLEPDDIVVE